ncbi:MAG: MAPEG family protein [Pseudomonadota bacterium]
MQNALSPELFWLTAITLLTALLWLPYIGNQLLVMGIWPAISNSDPGEVKRSDWAFRASAAHRNAVENLVVFAPLALAVHVAGVANETTALACLVYFWVRVAHYIIYTLGIPLLRTLSFAAGVICQLALAARLLGWS